MTEGEDHETAGNSARRNSRELEQKADDAEKKSANESEPRATEVRELAKLYREWIAQLRSGRWTS